ncbi:hypothetical protein N8A98_06925 [Devosia neptuniae]|uniref:DUF2442 domain-containing protein n=1 Tax=Devosia neptuniae TaxID=191302 RepID=A0ABY6CF94_9HYPH|nr:hypothetical protein [Devosia neptuniae]UXN70914.1 hypothetical protein N8A98_06925 [Devosia neptuniae]
MKFRWHRGSLADSMDTVVEFNGTKEALTVLLKADALPWFPPLDIHDVLVEPYTVDDRIGWDTYLVTVDGKAVGFTDGAVA